MDKEMDEVVITNKTKMDELMKLLEELVINKIRIEKIKQDISEKEYKKVLDQEIQIVAKVQEIVKKIQKLEMKVIYKKLSEDIKKDSKDISRCTFNGDDTEYDSSIENQLHNLLKSVIGIHYDINNQDIMVSAFSNSSNAVIEVLNKSSEAEEKDIYDSEHISLTYADEPKLKEWLSKISLIGYLNTFLSIKNASKTINASVELESEKNIYKKTIISIPYSSSITKAQFIKLSDQIFAIPVDFIDKIINVNTAKIEKSNGRDFIRYMDRIIPIILIDKKLDMVIEEDYSNYVVLNYNEQMKALPVNSIMEQSDIVVRPKPQAISEISEFKGTAILDDGNVTIVLDVPSLIQVNV